MTTLHDVVEQLSKNKSVKTIRYNPRLKFAIVYFHRVNKHTINSVIGNFVKNNKILVSVLRDKYMVIIRERP